MSGVARSPLASLARPRFFLGEPVLASGVARSPLASLARPRFFLGEPVLAARLGRLAAVRRVAPTGQANGQQGQPGIQGMSAGGAVGRGHPGRSEDAEARVAALLADGRRFAEQHVFQGFPGAPTPGLGGR